MRAPPAQQQVARLPPSPLQQEQELEQEVARLPSTPSAPPCSSPQSPWEPVEQLRRQGQGEGEQHWHRGVMDVGAVHEKEAAWIQRELRCALGVESQPLLLQSLQLVQPVVAAVWPSDPPATVFS